MTELYDTTHHGHGNHLDYDTVTRILNEGKLWLANPDLDLVDVVAYKRDVEGLHGLTIHLGIGKDAQLAAMELVRRTERAIAQAVRRAQERGEVRWRGDGVSRHTTDYTQLRDGQKVQCKVVDVGKTPATPSVTQATGEHATTLGQFYAFTDGIPDEQFEQVIAAARAERNLSRANVVRHAVKQEPTPAKRPEVLRGTRRFDSRKVVDKTVEAAADVITPSLLAEVEYGELDTNDLREWLTSLGRSIKALSTLRAQLTKELERR